jgi:hypothetical protein
MIKSYASAARFNGISDKNNLSLSVDVGFKFSKLPWTLNE